MSSSLHYRTQAEYCKRMALQALTCKLRSNWIMAAALWDVLSEECGPAAEHIPATTRNEDTARRPTQLPDEGSSDGVAAISHAVRATKPGK
jgi:hypothetical protein